VDPTDTLAMDRVSALTFRDCNLREPCAGGRVSKARETGVYPGWLSAAPCAALALLGALEDAKPQVRQVAIQALSTLTHQTKGYSPNGDPAARSAAVAAWRRWLLEYRANL
jgi:hypothetical protein